MSGLLYECFLSLIFINYLFPYLGLKSYREKYISLIHEEGLEHFSRELKNVLYNRHDQTASPLFDNYR